MAKTAQVAKPGQTGTLGMARVEVLGREIVAADDALDGGDRNAILGACNLLNDALAEVRDSALPVPAPAVDRVPTEAAVDVGFAVRSCLVGGRSAAAFDVEAAMALMDEARQSFDRAQAALAAWQ